jgi:aminoglycoside/choline kinase family phosphotransferase
LVFDTFAQDFRAFIAVRRIVISSSSSPADIRLAALKEWVSRIDALAGSEPVPASSDASFRRYFRLQTDAGSFIAMDAPPENEDCVPFLRVAGYLESMQLNAPGVLEIDLESGFLLLDDLGSRLYLDALQEQPDAAARLYGDALAALLKMQRRGVAFQGSLPPYDEKLLRFEMSLFHDWLCGKHLGIAFDDEQEQAWQETCDLLVANALDQPQVFVHRDYHSRNLMLTAADNPGIIDFQDAVEGPLTYDLVSLLKDCYVKWPRELVRAWMLEFYNGLDDSIRARIDADLFGCYFDLMGVQRHLKAAGIFARLCHRDGKRGFLADIPRTLSYITDLGPDRPELGFLVGFIDSQVLPALDALQ